MQWLLRLMVLVMAFTGPMQAFASLLQSDMSMCPAAEAHMAAAGAHDMDPAGADHCTHMQEDGARSVSSVHDQCGAACMGNCGACAHCPVGITQFSSAVELPPQFLAPMVQHRPGDVPPDAYLRPPRAFS